jgi:hypothetical protein
MERAQKLVHLVTEGCISQLHLFADDKVTLVRRPLPASRDFAPDAARCHCGAIRSMIMTRAAAVPLWKALHPPNSPL